MSEVRPENNNDDPKTMTVLFLDLVGSTGLSLWDYQDEWVRETLNFIAAQLNNEERPALRRNTWGDAVMATFASAEHAIFCALSIRDHVQQYAGWTLRIALHTGRVIEEYNLVREEMDAFGPTVATCARIEPCVQPSEIWASNEVIEDFAFSKKKDRIGFVRLPPAKFKKPVGTRTQIEVFKVEYAANVSETDVNENESQPPNPQVQNTSLNAPFDRIADSLNATLGRDESVWTASDVVKLYPHEEQFSPLVLVTEQLRLSHTLREYSVLSKHIRKIGVLMREMASSYMPSSYALSRRDLKVTIEAFYRDFYRYCYRDVKDRLSTTQWNEADHEYPEDVAARARQYIDDRKKMVLGQIIGKNADNCPFLADPNLRILSEESQSHEDFFQWLVDWRVRRYDLNFEDYANEKPKSSLLSAASVAALEVADFLDKYCDALYNSTRKSYLDSYIANKDSQGNVEILQLVRDMAEKPPYKGEVMFSIWKWENVMEGSM